MKISGKAVAIGLAAFVGLAGISAAIQAIFPGTRPQPTPEPVRTVATAKPSTPSPVPTATPYRIHGMDPKRTVYVSNQGVIHIDSDCSGMKHYREMPLEEADAAGYEYCSRCIG